MRKYRPKFRPNYGKIYPGVTISADVLSLMKKTDRREEYEKRRKHTQIRKDKYGNTVEKPPLEESLEALDENGIYETDLSPSAESDAIENENEQEAMDISMRLASAFKTLTPRERRVLTIMYLNGEASVSMQKCADEMKISQSTVQRIHKKAIEALKDLMWDDLVSRRGY
jgi:RNA polymerase sigma factor (sigma-70 family)